MGLNLHVLVEMLRGVLVGRKGRQSAEPVGQGSSLASLLDERLRR